MRRVAGLALALDAALVVAFAAVGRRSHEEAGGAGAVLEVAAPFLVGLVAGWAITRAWRAPRAPETGVGIALTTVAVGMVIRALATDRGTALAFVVVALLVLGGALVGWRILSRRLAHRTYVR